MESDSSKWRQKVVTHAQLLLLSREVLNRKSTFSSTAKGHSMAPVLRDGAKVTIEKSGDIRVGDVILGLSGTKLLMHRIKKITSLGVISQGDALPFPDDQSIRNNDVLGRVVAINGKSNVIHLRRPYSTSIACGVAFLVRQSRQSRFLRAIYRKIKSISVLLRMGYSG